MCLDFVIQVHDVPVFNGCHMATETKVYNSILSKGSNSRNERIPDQTARNRLLRGNRFVSCDVSGVKHAEYTKAVLFSSVTSQSGCFIEPGCTDVTMNILPPTLLERCKASQRPTLLWYNHTAACYSHCEPRIFQNDKIANRTREPRAFRRNFICRSSRNPPNCQSWSRWSLYCTSWIAYRSSILTHDNVTASTLKAKWGNIPQCVIRSLTSSTGRKIAFNDNVQRNSGYCNI